MAKLRLLTGVSIFWLALSMLSDGLNTLLLPNHILSFSNENNRATTLGLITFIALLAGMLVQPVAGVLSDQLRPRKGRVDFIATGVLFILSSLAFFGFTVNCGIKLVESASLSW